MRRTELAEPASHGESAVADAVVAVAALLVQHDNSLARR